MQHTPTLVAPSARRKFLMTLAGTTLLAPLGAGAQAPGTFPSRPLTFLVPFTAGGPSDVGARLLATELVKLLGQPVVVENLAGAGGALAVQKLLRAPADGHTLLYGGMSESLLVPMINPALGYRPDSMVPLSMLSTVPVAFVAKPDFPANTMDELVALVRKNPGKFSYGSGGIGSFAHVMGELVKQRAGMFMVHIPYRGGAQIVTDVIGGQIDLGINALSGVAQMITARQVKAIGVSSRERVAPFKDVPTFNESTALKGLEMGVWAFAFTTPGTPAPVVARLNQAINTALMTPAMQQARARLGAELPALLTPVQARAYIAAQQQIFEPITRGIKPE
jgi:tripartite-type tricarboxylate transporter receptor subunit TctC